MKTKRMTAVILILLGISVTGCGMTIGTTDYWDQYNETIRVAKGMRLAQLEEHSERDREELNNVIRRVSK